MSDPVVLNTVRDALVYLRDCGSHPGDYERGEKALVALAQMEEAIATLAVERALYERGLRLMGESNERWHAEYQRLRSGGPR